MMPMAMANRIQSARNRSSHPRPLNAETLSGTMALSISCFSMSEAFAGFSVVFIVTAVWGLESFFEMCLRIAMI